MKKLIIIVALSIGFILNAQRGNTSNGTRALNSNTIGSYNTASGYNSLFANTKGANNTASGYESLRYNTKGDSNTALGFKSLRYNTTGSNNTASGWRSLYANTTGSYNTTSGYESLNANTSGGNNTASGYGSLISNTTGSYNTASGHQSLYNNNTGDNNTALGFNAMASTSDATNQTMIGYNASGVTDNSVVLGNSDVTAVYMGEDSGATVYAAGLRTASNAVLTLSGDDATFADDLIVSGDVVVSSDARLKLNIVSLGSTLSRLLLIDGKSYKMKKNGKQKIGVLAQDIEKVFPELVSVDENEMLAVNYQGLVPVLINALKEQDIKMSQQQSEIDELKEMVKQLISNK